MWVAHGGRQTGRPGCDGSDEEAGGIGGGPGRSFRGVPLCGPAMCSGPGMPPRRLPQPGIVCVNGDRPCLPCDIVNMRLRTHVAGSEVKQAVAEAQRRYFCRVWNLLFSWMFPDYRPARCRRLVAADPPTTCRPRPAKARPPSDSGLQRRRLPFQPPEDEGPLQQPSRRPSTWRTLGDLQSAKPAVGAADHDQPSVRQAPDRPRLPIRPMRARGGLRYNVWKMPMPELPKK